MKDFSNPTSVYAHFWKTAFLARSWTFASTLLIISLSLNTFIHISKPVCTFLQALLPTARQIFKRYTLYHIIPGLKPTNGFPLHWNKIQTVAQPLMSLSLCPALPCLLHPLLRPDRAPGLSWVSTLGLYPTHAGYCLSCTYGWLCRKSLHSAPQPLPFIPSILVNFTTAEKPSLLPSKLPSPLFHYHTNYDFWRTTIICNNVTQPSIHLSI